MCLLSCTERLFTVCSSLQWYIGIDGRSVLLLPLTVSDRAILGLPIVVNVVAMTAPTNALTIAPTIIPARRPHARAYSPLENPQVPVRARCHKNINISDVGGDWHLCLYPYDGWPTVSSDLWIQLSLLVVATGLWLPQMAHVIGSV